jgi:Spy/CpxP family protein refolding chaperone
MPIVVAERQRGDIFRELNLSPEQTRQIQAIRDRYQGQLEQHKRAMRQEQQQLRSLMAGNASTEQIREQFRQLQAARQTLSEVQFNSFLEIRAVLTPQQRRKFAEIMGNRR